MAAEPVLSPVSTSAKTVSSEVAQTSKAAPTTARAKTTISLSGILKPSAPVETVVTESKEPSSTENDRPVSLIELQKAWKDYSDTRKEQVAEYHLLQQPFDLKENQIVIQLTNPVEEPLLQAMKSSLVEHLRDVLKNKSIQVSGVMKEFDVKRLAYTNKEKFDQMVAKNPTLAELKTRFGLDPDF